jgi:P4 family phage/plasmid primase-like protien
MFKRKMREYCTQSDNYTHVSLSGGKYYIPDDKLDDYYKKISKEEEYDICERHLEDKSPLILDFDFKLENTKRVIDEYHIDNIVYAINELLEDICINPNKLCYVLMRKKPYTYENKHKDGIHIIYPNIVLEYKWLYKLRETLLISLHWLETLSLNKIKEIIDEDIIKKNCWLLYGGNKLNITGDKYEIIKIYNNEMIEIENTYLKHELIKILSIRNKSKELSETTYILEEETEIKETNFISNEEYQNKEGKIDKNKLRYILMSILKEERAYNYSSWINIGMCLHNLGINNLDLWIEFSERCIEKYKKGECEKMWKRFKSNEDGLKYGTLHYYSKMDNKEKIRDLHIIDALKNVKNTFPNNQLMIENIIRDNNHIFINILDKYCPIYGNDHETNLNFIEMTPKGGIIMKCKCEKCFGRIYPNNQELVIDINNQKNIFNITINNYNNDQTNIDLDEDELKFNDIILDDDKELNSLLLESLRYSNGNAYDVAKILFYLYRDKYRYVIEEKSWYYYDKFWTKNNTSLKTKISTHIYDIYKNAKNKIDKKKSEDIYKKLILRIKNLLPKLKESYFKSSIMTESIEIFSDYCNNFYDIVDNNKYLLGFNNGVYDFNLMQFRDSKPDDNISMTVGYDYINEIDASYDKEKEERLNNFLIDIQPDEIQRIFLLKYLSTCLIGENKDSLFVILLGKGRNGKSKINELLSYTLGKYYTSFKSTLLTRSQTDADKPDPNLISMRKCRLAVGSEPDERETLNTPFIKLITGNDMLKTRQLHSNEMIEFTFQFKTMLLCNVVPKVNNPNDEAFWMRCKCVGFPTQFVEEPIEKNQKKIIRDLQINELKQYFMLKLIHYYKVYKSEGLKMIESVNNHTNELKISNNIPLDFMINYTTSSDDNIYTASLYNSFTIWFTKNYKNEKVISNRKFLASIKNNYIIEDNVVIKSSKKKSTGIKNLKLTENFIEEYIHNDNEDLFIDNSLDK